MKGWEDQHIALYDGQQVVLTSLICMARGSQSVKLALYELPRTGECYLPNCCLQEVLRARCGRSCWLCLAHSITECERKSWVPKADGQGFYTKLPFHSVLS